MEEIMSSTARLSYSIDVSSDAGIAGDRDTLGGWPVLDADQPWPVCNCGQRMSLYFQLRVPADVPHFGGDQLLVFQCPAESDACFPADPQLPAEFWDAPPENSHAFWRILLQRNGVAARTADPYLRPHRLELHRTEDLDHDNGEGPLQGFKVGGEPFWVQEPERYRCPCGSELSFLCQVPENFEFYHYLNDLDESVDCPAFDDGLLLGNVVYILACPAHCHPAAAYPVCQN
ncbi:hypothetical protein [Nocardia sp. NPDC049526]|uniref:hypothetical protein n=1 Tax=Nocardia sp. NPDC049526 TaxID=3364316 RepID=UPI00379C5589